MKSTDTYFSLTPREQSGFTLMEMIGVMAVIALLASVATPKIFEAIEDAKVSAFIQEAKELKVAVANHYKDTGLWPRHIPTNANSRYHDLMINDANGSGAPVKGWNGPYLERELTHQIVNGAYQDVIATNNTNWSCDLDGDGTKDGTFVVYRADNISDAIAKKISNIIDKDGDITTGNKRWQAAGKIKRYGTSSNHAHILLYCLTKV